MTSLQPVRYLDRTSPPHITTLVLMAGLSALSMSVFLPALASMAADFNVDYGVMQLALSGYLAATAIIQIVVGPISDRFGRRPVVLATFAIFAAASLGAALSHSVWIFLSFRFLQAAAATGMVLSRAVVRDMVPQEQAASMIGYVTMGMSLVPMVGPFLGGAVAQWFGWRMIFFGLCALSLALLVLVRADLGETVRGRGTSFRDQIRGYPELLTSQRFWGYVLCAGFSAGAFYALMGGGSFVAGSVYGLSPVWAGVALGSPSIGYALGNYLSGRHSIRVGINRLTLYGSLIATGGMGLSLLLSLAGLHSAWLFFGLCTFLGLGNGLTMPNTMAGSLSVRPHLAGTASGLAGAILIGGGALLSALAGSLLDESTGALPLQILMFATSGLSVVSILLVIRRERSLGLP